MVIGLREQVSPENKAEVDGIFITYTQKSDTVSLLYLIEAITKFCQGSRGKGHRRYHSRGMSVLYKKSM